MSYFGFPEDHVFTEEELKHIAYVICLNAVAMPTPKHRKIKCEAGCGTTVMCHVNAPVKPPKVCKSCAIWLSNCVGSA